MQCNKQHYIKNYFMESKNKPVIIYLIFIFILGSALFKEIDFETFTFKKTGLGILYLITLIFFIVLLIKGKPKKTKQ